MLGGMRSVDGIDLLFEGRPERLNLLYIHRGRSEPNPQQ